MLDPYASIEAFADFERVVDPTVYRPLPDDWQIGVSDIVDSRAAIEAGRYRAVNMAGAATISAVINALADKPFPFIFGGDGARLAIAPDDVACTRDALAKTANWARDRLKLDLRVGMAPIGLVREAGLDVRVARYAPSPHASYAMFSGGGIEWVEQMLKSGHFHLDPAHADADPDLTGLSCQWGPVANKNGVILSMIVKPQAGTAETIFAALIRDLIGLLGSSERINPVSEDGPKVTWPGNRLALQTLAKTGGKQLSILNRLQTLTEAVLAWTLFKTGWRVAGFDPERYRRVLALNTDYCKYDDGLMMTLDCSPATAERLRRRLDDAQSTGIATYGLHQQETAVMTCIAPSVFHDGHLHFLDGGGGGYTQAAIRMRHGAEGDSTR